MNLLNLTTKHTAKNIYLRSFYFNDYNLQLSFNNSLDKSKSLLIGTNILFDNFVFRYSPSYINCYYLTNADIGITEK